MLRHLLYRAGSAAGPLRILRDRHLLLRQSQGWSPRRIRNHQDILLGELLRHAAATVPFYRDHWRSRDQPPLAPTDLEEWPIIDAGIVRRHVERLRSERSYPRTRRLRVFDADGSPAEVVVDPEVSRWRWAATLRGLEWMGWSPGEGLAILEGGAAVELPGDALIRTALGVIRIPRDPPPERIVELLRRRRPRFLIVGAEIADSVRVALESTAAPLEMAKILVDWPPVSEPPSPREEPGEAAWFRRYHRPELGPIAQTASPGGALRINAESLVVESVLRDDGPHLVITDLRNKSFPLIRYDTGDLGSVDEPEGEDAPGLPILRPGPARGADG